MNKQKSEKRGGMGLNVGSASVIMLFAVLALTVLAALSLLSANAQLRIAERTRDTTTAYYAADTLASKIIKNLRADDQSSLSILTEGGKAGIRAEGDKIIVETRVSERLILRVTAERSGTGLTETSRRLIEVGEWIADDSMDIWDGWSG